MSIFEKLFKKRKKFSLNRCNANTEEYSKATNNSVTVDHQTKKLENSIMNGDTLKYEYAKMLKYLHKTTVGKFNEYAIERFGEKLKTAAIILTEAGLLRISTLEENIGLLTMPYLKEMLKEKGAKVSGRKAELVQRVLSTYSSDELKERCMESVYLLTDAGQVQLEKNHIFFANERNRYGFDHIEIRNYLSEHPNAGEQDVFYALLYRRSEQHLRLKCYMAYVVDCHHLATICYKRSEYKEAALHTWNAQFVHNSGLYFGDYVSCCDNITANTEMFDKLMDALGWSVTDLRTFILKKAYPQTPKLTFSYYSKHTNLQFICDKLNQEVNLNAYPRRKRPKQNNYDFDTNCSGYDQAHNEEQIAMYKQQVYEKQILDAARARVDNVLIALNKNAKLVNKTTNPETFFYRLICIFDNLLELITYEKYHFYKDKTPTDDYNKIINGLEKTVDAFIERSFQEAKFRITSLNTNTEKYNSLKSYIDNMVLCFNNAYSFYKGDAQTPRYTGDLFTKNNMNNVLKLYDYLHEFEEHKEIIPSTSTKTESESIDTVQAQWEISVSFGESSSPNLDRAIYLVQHSNKYNMIEFNGRKTYQGSFSSEPSSYLTFIKLYEMIADWKSTNVIINGVFADRKIVAGLNYCYGDKCRSGKKNFCYGASRMTENPFGCHRLQISRSNHPWWSFTYFNGVNYTVDKKAIRERIESYSTAYRSCPCFDLDAILAVVESLPDTITSPDVYIYDDSQLCLP